MNQTLIFDRIETNRNSATNTVPALTNLSTEVINMANQSLPKSNYPRKKREVASVSYSRKPQLRKLPGKGLKKVARKGEFWIFVSKVLNRFFLKIDMPQRCEKCDGSRYGGPIQPAHSRRRVDIRVGDWWYAFRVAVLCNDDHFEIDKKGRRDAEPIIEKIIADRFKRMGLSEDRVKELLLESAAEIQAEDALKDKPRFQEFLVTL
jgi:hypothetical protein